MKETIDSLAGGGVEGSEMLSGRRTSISINGARVRRFVLVLSLKVEENSWKEHDCSGFCPWKPEELAG